MVTVLELWQPLCGPFHFGYLYFRVMQSSIKLISYMIVLLGVVHISFALPVHMNTDTLWFIGSGMAIIFAGLLNIVAIDRGGSKFTKGVAIIVNIFSCGMFCFALPILNEPQIYVGIVIFLSSTIAFIIDISKKNIRN